MASLPEKIELKRKPWYQPLEHAAIGAGVFVGIALSAGWQALPAIFAALAVAGFKEGSDAWAGRDSIAWAVIDAMEIAAGAAIAALVVEALR